MFSANENLVLRQHKRRIVDLVESTIPEAALDMGTTVMVMQVSCKAPGCVPLETAIIIVFPNSPVELIPGLPESKNGKNYKTKILKPMADVTKEDVLEALPPAFKGGTRSMEKLCLYARDVMLAQITQLFGEEEDDGSVSDRHAMAEYLQNCLQEYINNNCKPPKLGELFPGKEMNTKNNDTIAHSNTTISTTLAKEHDVSSSQQQQQQLQLQQQVKEEPSSGKNQGGSQPISINNTMTFPKGNLIIRRVGREEPSIQPSLPTTQQVSSSLSSFTPIKGLSTKHDKAIQQALNPSNSSRISKLFEREHAPGIRPAGCPCCDPDNPSNVVDTMMML